VTAASTAALAASTRPRRGTAAKVARIDPVLNSLLSVSTPRMPMASWPSASPANRFSVGS
jgi:hypothetical protein